MGWNHVVPREIGIVSIFLPVIADEFQEFNDATGNFFLLHRHHLLFLYFLLLISVHHHNFVVRNVPLNVDMWRLKMEDGEMQIDQWSMLFKCPCKATYGQQRVPDPPVASSPSIRFSVYPPSFHEKSKQNSTTFSEVFLFPCHHSERGWPWKSKESIQRT